METTTTTKTTYCDYSEACGGAPLSFLICRSRREDTVGIFEHASLGRQRSPDTADDVTFDSVFISAFPLSYAQAAGGAMAQF